MKYTDLSDRAKERVREHLEPDSGWWEFTYEQAKADGAEKGFDIDDISFSGFYSQGDGAQWRGRVNVVSWSLHKYPEDGRYVLLRELIAQDVVSGTALIATQGRGEHEMCVCISGGIVQDNGDDWELTGIFEGSDLRTVLDGIGGDAFLNEVDDEILEAARDYARDIYSNLEAEYEHQTSDEYIADMCEANEYEFDEDGNWA